MLLINMTWNLQFDRGWGWDGGGGGVAVARGSTYSHPYPTHAVRAGVSLFFRGPKKIQDG